MKGLGLWVSDLFFEKKSVLELRFKVLGLMV